MKVVGRVMAGVVVALVVAVALPTGAHTAPTTTPVFWLDPHWLDCPQASGEILGVTDTEPGGGFRLDYAITPCEPSLIPRDLHGVAFSTTYGWWGVRLLAVAGQHSWAWPESGEVVTACVITDLDNHRGTCAEVVRSGSGTYQLGDPVPVDWVGLAQVQSPMPTMPPNPYCPAC